MQKIVRRVAVVLGSVAFSAGLMTVTSTAAHAEGLGAQQTVVANDSSWGRP